MRTLLLSVLLSVVPVMAADTYSFDLLPAGGSIGAPARSTIGWGYKIENQSDSLWLVTTGLGSGVFQHGVPSLIFDFPDLAPGASVTVPFNAVNLAGLEQFTWNSSAPVGFVNSGNFSLDAQWWNGDPLGSGTFVLNAPTASAFYSATVTPEPTTDVLVEPDRAFHAPSLLPAASRLGSEMDSFDPNSALILYSKFLALGLV